MFKRCVWRSWEEIFSSMPLSIQSSLSATSKCCHMQEEDSSGGWTTHAYFSPQATGELMWSVESTRIFLSSFKWFLSSLTINNCGGSLSQKRPLKEKWKRFASKRIKDKEVIWNKGIKIKLRHRLALFIYTKRQHHQEKVTPSRAGPSSRVVDNSIRSLISLFWFQCGS